MPTKEDTCCVSGIRGAALLEPRRGALEFAIDRYGGDYKSIDISADATGDACAKACEADNKCRAFTYLRPGYGNPRRAMLSEGSHHQATPQTLLHFGRCSLVTKQVMEAAMKLYLADSRHSLAIAAGTRRRPSRLGQL